MAQITWASLNLLLMLATCQAAVLSLQPRVVSRPLKYYGLRVSSENLFSLPILLPRTKQVVHAVFDTGSQKLVLDYSRSVTLRADPAVPCNIYPGSCECVNNICITKTSFFSLQAPAVVRRGTFSLSQYGPGVPVMYLLYTAVKAQQLEEDGVAGFGAGSLSVPRQFQMKRFSFCFSLNPYDSQSSWLADGPDARFAEGTSQVTVPFETDGYFIRLTSIQFGQLRLKVGTGKMVLFDTGAQRTYLDSTYYKLFLEMVSLQGPFNILPSIILNFTIGARMLIPPKSYSSPTDVQESPSPGVTILGVDWLQDYQFLYDIERRTISYSATSCPRSRPVGTK